VRNDRLLLETDAPFLTPVPHRGERNEPAYLRHVAETIALVRGQSLEEVARQTTQNAERLFGLG
jgi:TatD DNase family protein